jgi:nicotinate-nucleotide pyrophosphorylase (carboxylating)
VKLTAMDVRLAEDVLLAALREDLGAGDMTSRATVPETARATARFTTKQALVVAGLEAIEHLSRLVDPSLEYAAMI